ncbi:quinohemoprotein amine dehydrogenase subunit beta [Thiopseudomonas alkaliphila]|nr:quinohemoprotein amine dehydrogenase subunit beta [Thiopseudomonas alkaliphila]MDM1715286.1 quinohemoprotein amine dehydrogenase subunit beta [Thiopseudomonas alkaliphila]
MNNKKMWLGATLTALCLSSVSAFAFNESKPLAKGSEYLAVSNYPDNLHIIDAKEDKLYKTCKIPGKFGPGTVVMSPDKTRAYVLGNGFSEVFGFNVDNCEIEFRAKFAQQSNEDARSMFSFAVSVDGKEVYVANNPVLKFSDHYEVQQSRLFVYDANGGTKAKPIRQFPMPRQLYTMQAADDGSLYVAGPDIYKVDVQTGKYEVAIPVRNWKRENYGAPDVLYFWPHQQKTRDFSILYTAPKFKDEKQDPETADVKYGFYNVNLATGKTETKDFAVAEEIYFTGYRDPKDDNTMFAVLNRLTKYDIKNEKLLKAQELDHTYYCITFNDKADKIYLVGTLNDISIHNPDTLEKIGSITLPGGDMAITTAQTFIR